MIIDTKTYHVVKSQQFKFEVRPLCRRMGACGTTAAQELPPSDMLRALTGERGRV